MKPSMAIKPLVFAIAAIMAVAVQAGQNDRRNDHHNGHHHNNGHHTPPPTKIPVYATANARDSQSSTDNTITNQGTINEAEMNQSAVGASGNVGVNVAAGNGNQQDNAAPLPTQRPTRAWTTALSSAPPKPPLTFASTATATASTTGLPSLRRS